LDYIITSERRLRVLGSSRADADGEGETRASLNGNCFAKRIWWNPAQAIIAAIFEDKPDGRAESLATLFHAATLPVCTWNLRRPSDKPLSIAFN
jgi:hypothetical protein